MKVLRRMTRMFGIRNQATGETPSGILGPVELRLITEGKVELLI